METVCNECNTPLRPIGIMMLCDCKIKKLIANNPDLQIAALDYVEENGITKYKSCMECPAIGEFACEECKVWIDERRARP